MKAFILAIFCIAIGSFGTYAILKERPELLDTKEVVVDNNGGGEEKSPEPKSVEVNKYKDLVIIDSPLPESSITSPIKIKGRARGPWYFEGSFPVTLTNWDGLIIAEGIATAQGEWMTTEYVPFEVELEFPEQETGSRGFLILHKDNPSGLPENDDAFEITVFYK